MRRLTVLAGRRSRMHARTHAHTHARTHARTHSLTHSCTCIVLHSNRAHNSTPPAHSLPSSSLLFIPLSPHVVALGRPAMAALQLEAERGAGIKSRPLGISRWAFSTWSGVAVLAGYTVGSPSLSQQLRWSARQSNGSA